MGTTTGAPVPLGARAPGDLRSRSAGPDRVVSVSLVGSTGSIGSQALEVIEACPSRFEVAALGANPSVELLAEQARRFRPAVVAIADRSLAGALARALPPGIEVVTGHRGAGVDRHRGRRRGQRHRGLCRPGRDHGRPGGGPAAGPGQQGVDHRRCPGGAACPSHPRGRDHPGRLRALRRAPMPPGRTPHGRGSPVAHRLGRALPGMDRRTAGLGRGGRRPPIPPGRWARRSRWTPPP